MLSLTASGIDESQVLRCAAAMRDALSGSVRGMPGARVLGPAPLAVLKVNNRYRYRVTLCAPAGGKLRRVISDAVVYFSDNKEYKGVSVYADNDPSE